MEVGVEISQKIRSAIKAKLMELGSYVDDELPDYIMVMVANKKTKAQMAGDLSLFLGANTDTFTEWLHGLLVKLQAINVESVSKDTEKNEKSKSKKREKSTKGKVDSSKKDKEKKTKKSDTQKKVELSSGSTVVSTEKETASRSAIDTEKDQASGSASSSKEQTSESVVLVEKDLNEDSSLKVHDDVEDVRQLLVTETTSDALAEELETTETEVIEAPRAVKVTNSSKVKSNVSVLSVKSGRRLSRSKSHSPERPSISPRKRKVPISVIGSVSKADDEEEYDPHNPSVGNVASVVKVTRKSTVPPPLQANRDGAMDSDGVDDPPSKVLRLSEGVSLCQMKQFLADAIREAHKQTDEISLFTQFIEKSLRALSRDKLSQAKLLIQKALFNVDSGAVDRPHADKQLASEVCIRSSLSGQQTTSHHSLASDLSKNLNGNVTGTSVPVKAVSSAALENQMDIHSSVLQGLCSQTGNRSENQTAGAKSAVSSGEGTESMETPSSDSSYHDSLTLGTPSSHRRLILHNSFTKLKPSTCCESQDRSSRVQGDREPPSCSDKTSTSSFQGSKSDSIASSKGVRHPISKGDKVKRKAIERELRIQSPVSSSRRDVDSPHSTESCPPRSTSGLELPRRCIVSTSENSKEAGGSISSKMDQLQQSGSSRAPSQTKEQPFPSFLVDSIHTHHRPVPESSSVLKQTVEGEKVLKGASPPVDSEEVVESSKPISSEALRVMAKNLKITVINKRAIKSSKTSSSESSSEESDDGSSDDEEEEESEDEAKEEGGDNSVKPEVKSDVCHTNL